MPKDKKILINGHAFAAESPPLFLLNRAFRYGDSLFETILVHEGKACFFSDHVDRLLDGVTILGFEIDSDLLAHYLENDLQELWEQAGMPRWSRLRFQLWRAGEGRYTPETDSVERLAELEPLDHDPWRHTHKTFVVGSFPDFQLYHHRLSAVKGGQAQVYVLAARHARQAGWQDALLSSQDGSVAESSRANLFVLRGNNLFTPPLRSGCLPGVLRGQILRLGAQSGLAVAEKNLAWPELKEADGLFLTNVLQGIQPISHLEDHPCPSFPKTSLDLLINLLRDSRVASGEGN